MKNKFGTLVMVWENGGGTLAELLAALETKQGLELAASCDITEQEAAEFVALSQEVDALLARVGQKPREFEEHDVWLKRVTRELWAAQQKGRAELAEGGNKGKKVASKRGKVADPALYRDGLDRARAAAEERVYPGLAELIRQARRTGDETLEQAAWDVADERDGQDPGQAWRETVEMTLDPPSDSG